MNSSINNESTFELVEEESSQPVQPTNRVQEIIERQPRPIIEEPLEAIVVPYGRKFEPDEEKQYISNIQGFIDPTKKIEPWQETVLEGKVEQTPFIDLTLSYIGKMGLLLPDLIDKGFDEFVLEPDPNFKPTELPYYNDPQYNSFKPLFLGAKTASHADNIKFRIDHQLNHQQLTSNAGWWKNMAASAASEAINPLNYVFAGRAISESYSILKHALYWGGVNAGLAGITETIDQLTSEVEKPLSESFMNVTASALLGSIGGVAGIGLTKVQLTKNAAKLEKVMVTTPELEAKPFTKENYNEFILGLKADMGPLEANKVIKAFSKMSLIQTAYSDNPITREIATDLFEMGLSEGKIASLTTIKRWQSKYIGGSKDILKEYYIPWLEDQNKNTLTRKSLALLNFDKQFSVFDAEVDKAMRVGDIHENPHVQACAQNLRKIKNELVEEGLQPDVDIFGIHEYKIASAKDSIKEIKTLIAETNSDLKTQLKGLKKGSEARKIVEAEFEPIYNSLNKQLAEAEKNLEITINTTPSIDELKTQYAESHLTRLYDTKKIRGQLDEFRAFLKEKYYESAQQGESYKNYKSLLEKDILAKQEIITSRVKEIDDRILYHQERVEKLSNKLKTAKKAKKSTVSQLKEKVSKAKQTIKNFEVRKTRTLNSLVKSKARLQKFEQSILDKAVLSADKTALKLSRVSNDNISSIDYHLTGKPGISQHRLLAISDVDLSPWLIHSASMALNKEMRSLIPAIVLKKKFGSASVQGSLNRIQKWAEAELAKPGLSEKQRAKITRQLDEDKKNIEVGWNRARGIRPVRRDLLNNRGIITAIRTSRNVTTALKAGSFTFNVMQDIPNQVQFLGLKRTFATHLKLLRSKIFDRKNLAKDHRMLKSMGLANDTSLSLREELINDMLYGVDQNVVELTTQGLASLQYKASLINIIDEHTRMVSDYAMMDKIRHIVLKKKPNENDVQWMLDMGIDTKYFSSIRENILMHGETEGQLKFANIDKWDKETREIVADAMKKLETQSIILPSAGDLPRSFDNPVLGTFLLFKSFIFAATQKLMIPALQRPTLATVSALIVGWGMGMFQEVIRSILSGKEIPDWEELAFKGFKRIDQFGAVPWMWDIIQTAIGFGDSVKYGRSLATEIVGAPISVANDIQKIAKAQYKKVTEDKPYTDSDKNAVRRSIPFADLWYTRYATTKAFGIEFPGQQKEEFPFPLKSEKKVKKQTNLLPMK